MPKVARRVVRIAQAAGERRGEHRHQLDTARAAHHAAAKARHGDDAPAGGGLWSRLNGQPASANTDEGGVDLPGARVEVEQRAAVSVRPGTGGKRFADAAAGGEHPVDEIRQIEGDGALARSEQFDQAFRSPRAVRARGDLAAADRSRRPRVRAPGWPTTAPSSIAIRNMPGQARLRGLGRARPVPLGHRGSARLTTPAVTSRSRSSPSAGMTWLPITDRYVRSVPVDQPCGASSQRPAKVRGHESSRRWRPAGRCLPIGQLELQRPFGGGPGSTVLGHEPDAAVEVAELGPGLDLTGRLRDELDLAGRADRQRWTAHGHLHNHPIKDE